MAVVGRMVPLDEVGEVHDLTGQLDEHGLPRGTKVLDQLLAHVCGGSDEE